MWVPETQLDYDWTTRRLGLGQSGSRAVTRSAEHTTTVVAIATETPGATWNDLKRYVKEALSIGTPAAEAAIKAARTAGLVHVHHGPNRTQHHHPGQRCDDCPSK